MCSLISIIIFACAGWEVMRGEAHLRNKVILQSVNPRSFWTTVIMHCAAAATMAGFAIGMVKDAKAPGGRS